MKWTLLVLAGCASLKAPETLGESVRSYNDGVRWGRYQIAASHVPPEQRVRFVDDADARAKDLRIVDYEVLSVDKRNDDTAEVQVKMSWYLDSQGTLRETQARQSWERHGKLWVIVDEARARGAEMPGLQEPLMKQ